jgi:acetyl-CoA carboxylase biotin carboxyl carrier protein
MIDDDVHARVLALARAFRDGDLVRLRVEDDDFGVSMTRLTATAVPASVASAAPAVAAAQAAASFDIVSAELVGIVQFARPAVSEGSILESDRELAYVEALGIRNPVRSKGAGRVVTVFVTEGEPVEYGQPLFAIERHV